MSLTIEPLERAKARWAFLGAVESLGADGPLGALRELLPRGPWPEPGGGVHWSVPRWLLTGEVAALPPKAAGWREFLRMLPPDISSLQVALLVRWVVRWIRLYTTAPRVQEEVADLPPKVARVLKKAHREGLLWELPADLSSLQVALLVRWAFRWHLAASWCLAQGALTLWTWERHPELAEDPPSWGGYKPVAYFPGTTQDARRLVIEWDYDLEPRRAAEKRIADEVKRWFDLIEEAARRAGWADAPERRARTAERPPGWEFAILAKYQCKRVSQRRLAADVGLTRQAVRAALQRAADVLDLPLRRPGR